jgi:hypothetical protein
LLCGAISKDINAIYTTIAIFIAKIPYKSLMPIKEKIADTFVSAMLNSNELNVRLKCLD